MGGPALAEHLERRANSNAVRRASASFGARHSARAMEEALGFHDEGPVIDVAWPRIKSLSKLSHRLTERFGIFPFVYCVGGVPTGWRRPGRAGWRLRGQRSRVDDEHVAA